MSSTKRGSDTKHLERRFLTWHFVRDVPRSLRETLGKKRIVVSLQTHDLRVAQARRHEANASFVRIVEAARSKPTPDAAVQAGISWRETLARIEAGDRAVIKAAGGFDESGHWDYGQEVDQRLTPQQRARVNVEWELGEQVDQEVEKGNEAAAELLWSVAQGRATPLLTYVDRWLDEGGARGPLKERTRSQYRTDVGRLDLWARKAGVAPTIEAFTRKTAGRYVSEELVGRRVDPKTANRQISAASAYWRWLMKRAGVDVNPWERQSVAKPARVALSERRKRLFTDAEVSTLLGGTPGQELADLMRVAALSGLRIEEIYRLTVARCADGWFDVRNAKTAAGWRRVPIHSALTEIVTRRTAGKDPDTFLFHEPGRVREGLERSTLASKRFGTYRKSVKVHEEVAGARGSAVDFHSWRRWFITKARNAGFDQPTVAAVVGHEAGNITDDVYSGGPDEDVKRRLVEAVRLP